MQQENKPSETPTPDSDQTKPMQPTLVNPSSGHALTLQFLTKCVKDLTVDAQAMEASVTDVAKEATKTAKMVAGGFKTIRVRLEEIEKRLKVVELRSERLDREARPRST